MRVIGGSSPHVRPLLGEVGYRHYWLLALLAMLSIAVWIAVDLGREHEAVAGRERERLERAGVIAATSLAQHLQATTNALEVVRGDLPALLARSDAITQTNRYLQGAVSATLGVRTLVVVDAAGRLIASNREELIGQDFKGSERYEALRANPALVHVARPFTTPLGHYTIALGRARLDGRGAFDGYVLAIVDPSYFTALLHSLLDAPDERAGLIHGGGMLVYRTRDPEGLAGKDLSAQSRAFVQEHLQAGKPGSYFVGAATQSGEQRLIAMRSVRPLSSPVDWPLVVFVDRGRDAAFAAWRDQVVTQVGLVLAATVLVVAAFALLRRRERAMEALSAAHDAHRRAAAEALRLSELRHRTLVDATSAVTWSCPPSGLHVAPQPQWMAFTGQTAEQMLAAGGAGWADAVHPEDRAQVAQRWRKAVARGEAFVSEHRIRRHDGAWCWMSVHAAPIRDGEGRIVEWIGMCLDIGDRKAIEAVQAREGERFRLAVEAAPIAMLMADAGGRIVLANPALEEMFGYASGELLGRQIETLLPAAWYERHIRHRKDFFAMPGVRRMSPELELSGRRKDDSEFPVEVGISHIVLGQTPLAVATVSDVSEHRAAVSEQARARQAAEAANAAKTSFLANMSHEVRTPLNAILGMNELIRFTGVSERQADYLDKQRAAGEHLLEVIGEILEYSAMEAGRLRLGESHFSLADLVGRAGDMLQERIRAKGLRFTTALPATPTHFVGDATRLQQALLNYLGNAVKFTEVGHITLRAMVHDEGDDRALLRFEVEDSGIGIAAHVLERLFTPFEQADTSFARKHGGTGLGLAITREIAEAMGGAAGVTSTPGQGSTFWFTARVKKALAPAPLEPARTAEATLLREHAGRSILLVDDDEVSREFAQRLLERAGLRVVVADNGAVAVRLAGAQPFDLILMDLVMPEMDGLEAAARIRERSTGPKVPIVALTANAFVEDRAKCLAAGMVDLVAKPVDSAVLCGVVLRWLTARRN